MKILLINYCYFISGGSMRYLFNVKELFEEDELFNNYEKRVIDFNGYRDRVLNEPVQFACQVEKVFYCFST